MNPQPFPWHLLHRTTHATARALRDARRWMDHHGASPRIAERLTAIAHAPVDLRLRGAAPGPPVARAGSLAVAFEVEGEPSRFVIIVEAALAAALVGRGIKRMGPRVVDPKRAAPVALAGAFGAVVVAASRAASIGPVRVVWCGDAADLKPASLPARVVDLHGLVRVDHDAFEAHFLIPEESARRAPSAAFSSADLAALGDTPLALSVVASAAASTHGELMTLSVGDIWVPGEFLARTTAGKFFGDIVLASPARDRGVRARLGEDGALVLTSDAEEITMTSVERPVTESLADAPVVVRVEVGSVTLSAREWSALRDGDVITTHHKINEPVVLRVGGVEVARGELVEVEGEVGVRILTRS